ncbi:hypothetical protein P6709_19970, partial [Jeotgalibacillus sp. ET6]|nr:hypothetical protein [Jeotgalibacillus sp. ET6]
LQLNSLCIDNEKNRPSDHFSYDFSPVVLDNIYKVYDKDVTLSAVRLSRIFGIEEAISIVLAPHFSTYSVKSYIEADSQLQ